MNREVGKLYDQEIPINEYPAPMGHTQGKIEVEGGQYITRPPSYYYPPPDIAGYQR